MEDKYSEAFPEGLYANRGYLNLIYWSIDPFYFIFLFLLRESFFSGIRALCAIAVLQTPAWAHWRCRVCGLCSIIFPSPSAGVPRCPSARLTAAGVTVPAVPTRPLWTGCCQPPVPELVNTSSCCAVVLSSRHSLSDLPVILHHRVEACASFLVLVQQSAFLSWPLFHGGNLIQCMYHIGKMPFWLWGSGVLW